MATSEYPWRDSSYRYDLLFWSTEEAKMQNSVDNIKYRYFRHDLWTDLV